MVLYEENFSLYIYILIHDKLFLYTHWNSFSLRHTVYIQTLFTFKDFSFFPTHTYSSHKSFFIYTRCLHIQEFLSTHYLHTRNPFIHIFLFHTCIYTKTFFLFFTNMTFIHNASFFLLGFFGSFYFLRRHSYMKNSTRFRNFNKHY